MTTTRTMRTTHSKHSNRRLTASLAATATATTLLLTACGESEPEAAPADTTNTTSAEETSAPAEVEPGEGVTALTGDDTAPQDGGSENFTGDVSVRMLFNDEEDSAVKPGEVSFDPGARTNWHTHPAGQRLLITDGAGWVQEEGGERIDVAAGDVVWFEPGVRHWHGAQNDQAMTHIAIAEAVDGSDVDWQDPVTDEQYEENS
ncbi:(R)-mandelonitrile lyase [Corynebacterium glyciniphilum]|uniref:(R)-mandelonitrile lyase n=1 Tax=Corynebacterium glyciniphilum TaxID=1404244 RepID=UPI003DA005E8